MSIKPGERGYALLIDVNRAVGAGAILAMVRRHPFRCLSAVHLSPQRQMLLPPKLLGEAAKVTNRSEIESKIAQEPRSRSRRQKEVSIGERARTGPLKLFLLSRNSRQFRRAGHKVMGNVHCR
jgi:hypothetical protein